MAKNNVQNYKIGVAIDKLSSYIPIKNILWYFKLI